jgi:hypothetical protein
MTLEEGHWAVLVGAAGAAKVAGSRMVRPQKRAKSDALVVSRRRIPWFHCGECRVRGSGVPKQDVGVEEDQSWAFSRSP